MGREQDLLHAAKNGNVAQIERILGQRNRRSGIHSFISRNVSSNFQDDMGYTALHYSSLNGHKTSVELLLKYDASANIPDNSGNSPLHLAAFNGHAEVARILINQGPSRANVNEQNATEDTALHSAAQYDHNQVVAVLLENHGDPFLRNCRQESALDLAARYGRMEPVKLLLSYHPNLLQSFVKTHTPLHLAARNGHVSVVSYLLSCGMDVNTRCDSGTALHDSSLFGKVDVVNLLLQCGVDLQVKNKDDLTVMDLLMTHPSTRTQEISKTIYNYSQSRRDSLSNMPMGDSLTRANTEIYRRPVQEYDTVQAGARPESGISLKRSDTYDPVPVPRSRKEMRAMSYDSVPEPRLAGTQAQQAPYDSHHNGTSSAQETRDPTVLPHGYCLIQDVNKELQATSSAPILTQKNVQDGYSVLRPPVNPSSKDPLPLTDMVGQENVAYFLVGPPSQPFQSQDQVRSQTEGETQNQRHSRATQPDVGIYDFVGRQVEPSQPQDRTQVKSGAWGQTQGPQADVGFYDFVGNTAEKSEGQGQEYTDHGFYDFVGSSQKQSKENSEKTVKGVDKLSTKRTSQGSVSLQSTYDLVQIPVQPTRPQRQVQKPDAAMILPQTNYDMISFPPKSMTLDLSNNEDLCTSQSLGDEIFGEGEIYAPVAQLEQARHGSDNHCPLDVPDYEEVTIHAIRKQHSESRSSKADEEKPFAFLPGYEPMGPPEPSPGAASADYEFVCLPSQDSLKDGYVALSPPKESETRMTGSPSQLPSSGIQQRRTGSVVSQGTPTYEVAPPPRSVVSQDTPTYEVAPPPRSVVSQDTPTYEVAPPPRSVATPTYEVAPPPRSVVSHDTPSYEIAPPPRRAENTDTQTYEIAPMARNAQILQSASVYEIAPPPRSVPSASQDHHPQGSPPVYEIAPTPRQRTKVPPRSLDLTQRGSSKRPVPPPPSPQERTNAGLPPLPPRPQEPSHGQPLFQKESDAPKVPPRRMNEYSQVTIGAAKPPSTSPAKQPTSPSGHLWRPGAYEEVRPEGPALSARGDAIDWSRIQLRSETNDGGEYCALATTAIGTMGPPAILPRRSSETSSTSSVPSETLLSPDFPPPSPYAAEQEIHRVLSEHKSRIPSVETIPENVNDYAVEKRRRPKYYFESVSSDEVSIHDKPPPISPRVDSLYDEEFELDLRPDSLLSNEQQDPFSFPPSAAATNNFQENLQQTDFATLHKRFSPHTSRENLAEEVINKEKEEDKETADESQGGALIYENVLFKKREPPKIKPRTPPGIENEVKKQGEVTDHPESYRLSSLSSESPLDESAEWKKIEEFLSAIGEIEVPENLGDQIADAGKAQTIGEWLHALRLSEYESALISNGFDDLNFMNGGILEDQDLLEVGIIDPAHRKIILEAVKSLPAPPRLCSPGVSVPRNLTEWLEFICLPEYFQTFNHNGYVTMERIKMLWELELTAVLEINTLGHRKRMLASLKEPLPTVGNGAAEAAGSEGNVDLEAKLAELRVYCPDEAKQDKPVLQTTGDATDMMDMAEKMVRGENVSVKPSSRENKPKKGRWKHDPAVLLKGSVNYTISYLGSHLVKTITGVESTVAACQKMRASTAKLQKVPSVQLSLSASGVKFIDARSQILVSFHDVKNISYITQDPDEKQVFAYIAKDSKTEKHYCHVFKATSNDLSDEITMTIGQAFELAYQQYMHVRSKLEASAQCT